MRLDRIDQRPSRQWMVYESSQRWIRVARRFASELETDDDPISVTAMGPISGVQERPAGNRMPDPSVRSVILWEVDSENIQQAAAAIAQCNVRNPGLYPGLFRHRVDLHLVAASRLSAASQLSMCELGVATIIRRPEELPRLRNMFLRHWAGTTSTTG